MAALRPDSAISRLEAARSAGISLLINLAGGRRHFQEPDGAFSLSLFMQRLGRFQAIDFQPYVADGTVIGHLLFDEPHDPSNWNGSTVPFEDIEAAAAYSKQLWPSLPAGVGSPPGFLQGGAPWISLDTAFAQYTARRGDVTAWRNTQVSTAQASGLGLALSINVLSGGNNRGRVTADQLRDWGSILASEPYICALTMWKYDSSYFNDPAIADSVTDVAQVAQSRPPHSCLP